MLSHTRRKLRRSIFGFSGADKQEQEDERALNETRKEARKQGSKDLTGIGLQRIVVSDVAITR